jgi:hypothetical protein
MSNVTTVTSDVSSTCLQSNRFVFICFTSVTRLCLLTSLVRL